MPYKNIQFVKVKMELLEDHRFLYDLNESQKGFYLLLLALAGKTNNKIKNDLIFIKGRLNIQTITDADLERISQVYPKFHLINGYWEFDNFDREHNQILSKDIGISRGYPKDSQRIDKKRIEKNRIDIQPQVLEFLEYFNQKTGKTLSLTDARKKIINDALKFNSINKLKQAVDNFSKDEWPDRRKYMDIIYCIGTIRGINNLDKWATEQPKNAWVKP